MIGIVPFVRNAPRARAFGVDLDMSVRATDAVTFDLGNGHLDSEYRRLVPSGVDLAGNMFSNAPNMTFDASADVRLVDDGRGVLHVLPNAVFTGDTWLSPFDDRPSSALGAVGINRLLYQSGYRLVNLRAQYDYGKSLSFGAYVKNLAARQYLTAGVDLRSGADYLVRGDRRTFGGDVTSRF